MLDKSLRHNEVTKHIKSLSDVKELRLTRNRAYKDEGPDKGDVYIDVNETQFVCPVTALGMSGINTFFVNWDCGSCLVSYSPVANRLAYSSPFSHVQAAFSRKKPSSRQRATHVTAARAPSTRNTS